jgi:hypothetical protein
LSPPAAQVTQVKVVVTFPLGTGRPYTATEPYDATVLAVRVAAMQHFGVHEEPGSRYFLTFGPHHDEVADDQTLKSLENEHGKSHEDTLKFTLVKELIQG